MAKLDAPPGFWNLTPEEKAEICNGAGAANGVKVPNTMYGLNIRPAFDIHDYEYSIGKTQQDKADADYRMLNNALRIIDSAGGWWNSILAPLRRRRAIKYYEAVYYLGGPAFWDGRDS